MVLHQYDYLFAVGTIFAFLDAWNIGANDVANSWASSVSSRSISYLQAMCAAAIMEFSGAVGVGGRVADTIRTKVVDTMAFESEPALLMLGMVCAVIASASYLTVATRFGMLVSTTHSILGGVLGMGVGALGASGVTWVGYKDNGSVDITQGVVQVFLAWIIAPIMSGCFAAILFLITKYGVLLRPNPAKRALMYIPVYFWLTASMIIMLLLWKGGDYEINLTESQIPIVIVFAGLGFSLLIALFLVPWIWRVAIKDDWQMKPWHIFQGPMLWRRGDVPPPPPDAKGTRNFYEGRLTKEELDEKRARAAAVESGDVENGFGKQEGVLIDGPEISEPNTRTNSKEKDELVKTQDEKKTKKPRTQYGKLVGTKPDGRWFDVQVLVWYVRYAVFRGVDRDVLSSQGEKSALSGDMEDTHARAQHFDNRAEFLYTFLQVMTAAAASFVHGANDVANAVGPYASIYQIWRSGEVPGSKSNVPVWILAFGGAGIMVGLWTYGYHIMKNLGNRVTLMSPSRGFCMELGSTITIVVATRLELPVSTTQCITGAIVGVGLCNGDWRTINWRMVAWIYLGWFITVPTAGLIAGLMMGFIVNAPRW